MEILKDLEFRNYIFQVTSEESLRKRLIGGPVKLYCGFDPTADSLHVGNLIPILGLRRFQLAGHTPIALVGGGTGLIGDPSGKAEERQLNSPEVVAEFAREQSKQLTQFLDTEVKSNPAQIVSNFDWLSELKTIDFFRDIGKHFPIGYMLAKDSVSSRLEAGISFTEFSYMILQAYDFLELNRRLGCELQIGGSDQWGNITSGIELIRRMDNRQAFGLTFPLLEKSDGTKFGKTESGTIWLDANKTSPYQFYQFWIQTDDQSVVKYLKLFTFMAEEEIKGMEEEAVAHPEKREAQKALASAMTTYVHGKAATDRAIHISEALFYSDLNSLSEQEVEEGFSDVPSHILEDSNEQGLVDVLVSANISSSKRQAREDIQNGAIYINGDRSTDLQRSISPADGLCGKFLVIRRGKNRYFLVKWAA